MPRPFATTRGCSRSISEPAEPSRPLRRRGRERTHARGGEAEGVVRRRAILFEPSFHVGHGEVVALMGRNGAGKSTTFKALMALIPQRSGTVRFLGEDISHLKPFEIARRGLGFVPEDRRIFSDLTVAENLDVGRQPVRNHPDGKPAPSWTPEKLFTIFPN